MPISWVVNFRLAAGLVRSERAFSREEVEVWLELLFEASQPLTLLVIAAPDGSFGMFSFELKPWLEQSHGMRNELS